MRNTHFGGEGGGFGFH